MTERILSQAIAWGFICKIDSSGSWVNQSQHKTYRWLLQQVGEQWVLSVDNVPQIDFSPLDALTFLEWCQKNLNNLTEEHVTQINRKLIESKFETVAIS